MKVPTRDCARTSKFHYILDCLCLSILIELLTKQCNVLSAIPAYLENDVEVAVAMALGVIDSGRV